MQTNHPRVDKRNQETVTLISLVLPEYRCMLFLSVPPAERKKASRLAVLCLEESTLFGTASLFAWDSESDYEDEEIDDFEDEDLIDDDDLFDDDDDDDFDDDYDDLEEEDDDYDEDFDDLEVDQDEDDF